MRLLRLRHGGSEVGSSDGAPGRKQQLAQQHIRLQPPKVRNVCAFTDSRQHSFSGTPRHRAGNSSAPQHCHGRPDLLMLSFHQPAAVIPGRCVHEYNAMSRNLPHPRKAFESQSSCPYMRDSATAQIATMPPTTTLLVTIANRLCLSHPLLQAPN